MLSRSSTVSVKLLSRLAPHTIQGRAPTLCRSAASSLKRAQVSPISVDRVNHDALNNTVANLGRAVKEQKLLIAWQSYSSLRDHEFTHVLGPPILHPLSRMIANLCESTERTTEEESAMEQLALACAVRGNFDGLRRLMILYLAESNPTAVARLYDTFVLLKDDSQTFSVQEESVDVHSEEYELEQGLEDEDTQHRTREAELVIITVAAHAMRDSFEDAVHVILKRPNTRVSERNVHKLFNQQLLKSLRNGDIHKKTAHYINASTPIRMAKEIKTLRRHVRRLVQFKREKELQDLSDSFVAGYTGPHHWAALNEKSISHSRPFVIPESVWAVMLHAFLRMHRNDLAEQLWEKIIELGITPGVIAWNGLLDGFRAANDIDRLLHAWNTMRIQGIEPNAHSYSIKISALFSERRVPEALSDFEKFQQLPQSTPEHDRLTVFNTFLHGLLAKNDIKGAVAILEAMHKNGPKPDIVTYNTFMAYHGRRMDIRGISGVINQMAIGNIQPDVFSFTTILTCLLRTGVEDAPGKLIAIMKKCGVGENVALYTTLIDHQIRSGTPQGIRAAHDLLSKMENSRTMRPNEITYSSILIGLHRCKGLDGDSVTSMTRSILKQIMDRQLALKRGTCQVIFKAFFGNPAPEGLSNAMEFYHLSLGHNVSFGQDTWYILLSSLSKRQEWEIGRSVIQDMLQSGHEPTGGLKSVVDYILRH